MPLALKPTCINMNEDFDNYSFTELIPNNHLNLDSVTPLLDGHLDWD